MVEICRLGVKVFPDRNHDALPATDAGSDVGTQDAGSDAAASDGPSTPDAGPPTPDAGSDLCAEVDCSGMNSACAMGMCNPLDGTCMAVALADETACDDEDLCTTNDVCTAGTCGGSPVECAGDSCNAGECNPVDGSCMNVPLTDGVDCNTDLCAMDQTCVSGVCGAGVPVDCSATSDACNVGMCNPADGTCEAAPLAPMTRQRLSDVELSERHRIKSQSKSWSLARGSPTLSDGRAPRLCVLRRTLLHRFADDGMVAA